MSTTPYNIILKNAIPPQTVTATANSTGSVDVTAASNFINIEIVAASVTGTTPSFTINAQWSFDNGTSWSSSDSGGDTFTAITAAGQKVRQVTPKGPLMRLQYTVTGTTPSGVFTVNLYLT